VKRGSRVKTLFPIFEFLEHHSYLSVATLFYLCSTSTRKDAAQKSNNKPPAPNTANPKPPLNQQQKATQKPSTSETQNTHNMHSLPQPAKNNIAPCTQVKQNNSTHFQKHQKTQTNNQTQPKTQPKKWRQTNQPLPLKTKTKCFLSRGWFLCLSFLLWRCFVVCLSRTVWLL